MQPQQGLSRKSLHRGASEGWVGERRWFSVTRKSTATQFFPLIVSPPMTPPKWTQELTTEWQYIKSVKEGWQQPLSSLPWQRSHQQWNSMLQLSSSSSGLVSSLCTQWKVSLQPKRKTEIAPDCTRGLMSRIHSQPELIHKIKLARNPDQNYKKGSFMGDFIWCPVN